MRKMKDSGLDIVGYIPSEWDFIRLRYLCDITTGDSDTQDADPDGEYPFYVRSPIVERSTKFTFNGEGILMAGDGAGAGRVFHHAFGKYAVHQRVYRLYNFKINSNFLFYYVSNLFPSVMDKGSAQSTVPSVRLPMLLNFEVCTPPLAEQQSIADFLDEKCGEIDSIRSDIQKQIDILNDYKKSVITEAVTGRLEERTGFCSTDERREKKWKDSRIPRIGKIPVEWGTSRIKYVCSVIGSGTTPSSGNVLYYEGSENWIQSGDLYKKKYITETEKTVTDYAVSTISALHKYKADFIVIAMYGASIGNVAISKIDACVNQACCVIKPNSKVNFNYLYYTLINDKDIMLDMSIGGTQPNISQAKILELPVLLPPLPEQKAIADYLDEKCSAIDATIADKQRQLETLDEYKKSLIFEYVTGKKEVPT